VIGKLRGREADAWPLIATGFDGALRWRNIGPFRGGRSNCATGVVGNPNVYYQGTTGGGLWKTDDMGITWRNVSDGFFKTGSVGAVAVAESDPNIVYVGMGEHAVRGVMTSGGDGIYKSTDGGETWTDLTRAPGLPKGIIGTFNAWWEPWKAQRVSAAAESAAREDGISEPNPAE
jgi:photosystem II stability/assembly factor-like uncharacterized protein